MVTFILTLSNPVLINKTLSTETVYGSLSRWLIVGEVPRHSFPQSKTYFFPLSKNNPIVPGNTRNTVFTRCGHSEGHQNCATLTKGLPYSSNNNGDQWCRSLEKYIHRRDSHTEEWHKNTDTLRIQILLETHPLPGVPGSYGQFETGAVVQTKSRARWVLFTCCQGDQLT